MSDIVKRRIAARVRTSRRCPNCSKHLTRTHRTRLEKLVYSEVFRCSKCSYQTRQPYLFIRRINYGFVFSRYTHCVRCGTIYVKRVGKRDSVDSVSTNIFSRVQHILAAPLNKCSACRLQYYDWRRPLTSTIEEALGKASTPARSTPPGD